MIRRASGAAIVALALAGVTGCSVHHDGDTVTHETGPDYFGAGGMLNLTDRVEGDAILAGGQVTTASEITGDLMAVGGEVSVAGAIGDDLNAAGGTVRLDAIVNGNVRLAGGEVNVGPATIVAGGVSINGGQIEFQGVAQQYLKASGASVRLDGEVIGDVEVRARELLIGPSARIGGRLVYHGPSEPTVPEGAVIGGIEFHPSDIGRQFQEVDPAVRDAATGLGTFLWFLGMFLAGALFVLLLPGFTSEAAAAIGRKPWPSLGLGLAILLCVPFVAVVLLVTIIGIPVALLLMSLYLLVLFLGWITTALFVAQRGLAALRPSRPLVTRGGQLLALLAGLVVLWLLRQLPLVGGLIGFVALLAGIGALAWRTFNGSRAAAA